MKKELFTSAIIVAAGNSTRMGKEVKKQFLEINNIPVIVHTVRAFLDCKIINEIIVVVSKTDMLYMYDIAKEFEIDSIKIVCGGNTRAVSVKNGISAIKYADMVLIHDGARPLVENDDILNTVNNAFSYKASSLAVRVTDTIKKDDDNGFIDKTIDRGGLWQMQTPQCFSFDLINKMYNENFDETVTDDCMLAEKSGVSVFLTEGKKTNIKITTPSDFEIVEALIKNRFE